MTTNIFINLPVTDLQKSMSFYTAIGFKNNPQFTDDTAACMILSEQIYVMLLTHDKFKMFTPKAISNGKTTTEVINAFSLNSNAEVDALLDKVIKNGGTEPRPVQDLGFMYSRAFEDLDGHIWEVFFMDMSKFPKQ